MPGMYMSMTLHAKEDAPTGEDFSDCARTAAQSLMIWESRYITRHYPIRSVQVNDTSQKKSNLVALSIKRL